MDEMEHGHMEEFSEIDREIERLRQEMAVSDEGARRLFSPGEINYWKRRLDEEKILLHKKLESKDEEKKAVEAKLAQQQSLIEDYNKKLEGIQRKFDHETRTWEDRLRNKEADLLIEKNRLLSEERIKHLSIEKDRLLEQTAELNTKINTMREEHLLERDKLIETHKADLKHDKDLYEEKIKVQLEQIGSLKQKIEQLEKQLADRELEFNKYRAEQDARLKVSEEYATKLMRDKDALEKEAEKQRVTLLNENTFLKKQAEQEKKDLESSLHGMFRGFVKNLNGFIGPLMGLIQFNATHRTAPSTWNVFKELVQKLENETEMYLTQIDAPFAGSKNFTAAAVMPDEEFAFLEKNLGSSQAKIKRLELKTLLAEIGKAKPQVALISSAHLAAARAVRRRWNFLPVIVFGEIKNPKLLKRVLAEGLVIVSPPYAADEVVTAVNRAAYHSLAWPEFWGQIRVQKPGLLAPALAVVLAVSAAFAVYRFAVVPGGFSGFFAARPGVLSTPYPQPSNVAYDGRYLWVCDWMGQSIYKHRTDADLTISRIFYTPGRHLTAITWAGGYLWSSDPWEKKIFKHNLDENLTVVASYPTPNAAPSGLAGDGKALWSCDSARGQIFRHRLDKDLTVEKTCAAPGQSPSGLYFDGKNLWSIDSKTNKIYRHAMDDALTVEAAFIPPGYEQKGYNLSGIAGTGREFWACSEKAGKIYRYSLASLREIPLNTAPAVDAAVEKPEQQTQETPIAPVPEEKNEGSDGSMQ